MVREGKRGRKRGYFRVIYKNKEAKIADRTEDRRSCTRVREGVCKEVDHEAGTHRTQRPNSEIV